MDIATARQVLVRTHLDAIESNVRAGTMLLLGPPGIGKTEGDGYQYVADMAKHLNQPVGLLVDNAANYLSYDSKGFMLPIKNPAGGIDTVFSTPTWFPTPSTIWVVEPDGAWHMPGSWKNPVPAVGVVFFDEFPQAEEDTQKSLSGVLLEGRLGDRVLPVNWRVIAAGNRARDRSGAGRTLMHLINRVCVLDVEASLPAYLDYHRSLPDHRRLHYLTLGFVEKNPGLVFQDAVPDGSDPYCTIRSITFIDRDLKALRSAEDVRADRMPMDDVAREVARGRIGQGAATQLFNFYKFSEVLPDIADIERDPASAKVPPTMDAQMVIAYFIAHHLKESNVTQLFKYMMRLNNEMQIIAVNTIRADANKVKYMLDCAEFNKWCLTHKDLLIASHS